jgi:glycosyltransferase involved in cell wall biosynthesis
MFQPLVSVIITTKNEAANLPLCLQSITEQTYRHLEIIVIDNHSTDDTKKIARRFTSKVFNKGPERSAQRNYGIIQKSHGTYVMFIDADMILAPHLIANCLRAMQNTHVDALWIKEVVLGKSFFARARRFERSFYDGTCIDGARFFNKAVFKAVNGFDLTLSGPEDWDLDKKLKASGYKISLLPTKTHKNHPLSSSKLTTFLETKGVNPNHYQNVIYHNESALKLKIYLTKKKYYSQSFTTYINKWGRADPDIKKQFGFYYRYFGVFLENGKWKNLLAHPLLTLGMYALRFLVGLSYLTRKIAK